MANNLYIPLANPVNFYEIAPPVIDAWITRHFDSYSFRERLEQNPWEEQVPYFQKWQTSDTIRLQFESNFDPIQVDLINSIGQIVLTAPFSNVLSNTYQPGYYVYETTMSLAAVPEGCYFLKLSAGADLIMISELMEIKVSQPGTCYLQYNSGRYVQQIVPTDILFAMRVEATIGNLTPGDKKATYEDQELDVTVNQSRPFRIFDFVIGGSLGVADWVLDKVNRIWGFQNVTIDGKPFAVEADAPDITRQDDYPLVGVTYKVREGINRYSHIISDVGINTDQKLLVVDNLDHRIFGSIKPGGSNDNSVQILNEN